MRRLNALALALTAVTLACELHPIASNPSPDIEDVLEGSPVAPGGVLTVEHRNTGLVAFGVNECGRAVERWNDAVWEPVAPELRLCPAALRIILPNELASLRLDVPLDVSDGMYRFKLQAYAVGVALEPGVHDIVSSPFLVER